MKNRTTFKLISIYLIVMISLIILLLSFSFAGTIEKVNDSVMYKTNSGNYATNIWAWLDINGDSVKECYRFDEEGHIAINYVGNDGRRTNDKGQLVENGFVMKKLSSGTIIKGDGTPYVNSIVSTGSIINNTGSRVLDNLPFEVVGRNGDTILTTRLKEKVVIPIDKNVSTISNIIYANGASGAISTITSDDRIKSNNHIVAGKNIENYITAKNNAKVDVEKVIIFGNDIWEDVIELRGNGSSIKFNVKNFNYMYFEVAEENHVVDKENDELLTLDVYIDGELYESLDEFVESEPQVEEIEELDGKVIELKVNIVGRNKGRRVYIRNGRLKKIREKDE
jgi:hypothetical protein